MANSPKPAKSPAEERFVISRQFDVPRDLMFDVWTNREHLLHWWGPKGFVVKTAEVDLRPGGMFHYCLQMPDGSEMWGKFLFREIDRPERLIYISSFSDVEKGTTRHPMSIDWPLEILSTISFIEQDGKTTVTVEWEAYQCTESERAVFKSNFTSMKNGWGGTFEQLKQYLATL
jgi:uncharacterized protein YndB with AHSA1/START domain